MANIISENPIVKVVMLKGQDGEDKLINQADGSGLSFWVGTQAEYDAISEKVTNCVYYITDDTRDDFRTDLNALDNKVDNNYTELNGKVDDINDDCENLEELYNTLKSGLYFADGDTGKVEYYGAGYITNAAKQIHFSVPMPKLLTEGLTVTEAYLKIKMRQGGNYVGSSATTWAIYYGTSVTATKGSANLISVQVDSSTAIDGAVNNDLVAIEGEFQYTIGAV